MESQLMPPHHGHAHEQEVDPHTTDLRTAVEGEEKHHDDKPAIVKKVKEKVKKIKDKIGKKKHDDGRDHESDTSSEEEEDGYKEDDDPNITSAPASDPQRISLGDAGKVEPEKMRLGDVGGDVREDPAAKVRLSDVTGDVKEDPAAPMSTNPPARGTCFRL